MKDLTTIPNTLTMSSLEIAELTGKQHKNVLRDINVMLKVIYKIDGSDLSHDLNQGVRITKDDRGYTSEVELDKHHTTTLITGYSIELRHKVNGRWLELEDRQSQPKTQLEILQDAVVAMVAQERKLLAVEAEQELLKAEVKQTNQRLDQIETGIDHFTVIGYSRAHLKKSLPLGEAIKLGKRATAVCNSMGIAMGTVPDPRFGQVNTYPKSVLDEVCH